MICCDICEAKISGDVRDANVRTVFSYTDTSVSNKTHDLELCRECARQLERRTAEQVETMRARPGGRVGRG